MKRKDKQMKKKLIGVYKQGGTQIAGVRFPDYRYKKVINEKIQKVTAELNQSQR